ncbi:aminotransferase class I/II-fold pyridoxal phosphate-dependent enzyme [Streptomyces sp. JH002]|uniref:aminotransferase class I/II-fold pyridoxal phosphate-dependent enzyme n=1 Tax=Streptomyces sp. JH002 TaxID=2763259 RepID=UPI003D800DF6
MIGTADTGNTSVAASLTPLQRRLAEVAAHPEHSWTMLLENVPVWPTRPPVDDLGRAAETAALYYPGSFGDPELLTALAYRERTAGRLAVAEDHLLVTHGGLHAAGLVFRELSARGVRRLVCQTPLLGSIADLALASGLDVKPVSTELLIGDDGPRAVAEALLPSTSAVYLNSPHNPTGHVLAADRIAELLALAEERGCHLVLDAVYDDFDFTAAVPAGAPLEPSPSLVVLNSFSKNYGAPGLRIGWLCADPVLLARLAVRLEYEVIAVSGPGQRLATRLLAHGNEGLRQTVRDGRAAVARWWEELTGGRLAGFSGGTQAWLPLPGVTDDELFADRLMRDHGIVAVTSHSYVGDRGAHLRLPVGLPLPVLEPALHRLGRALRATYSLLPSDDQGV